MSDFVKTKGQEIKMTECSGRFGDFARNIYRDFRKNRGLDWIGLDSDYKAI